MEGRASRQGCNPLLQWHLLPPEVLCVVFGYLKDSERCQARLVCKTWDGVFRMPQLWRRRKFAFRGLDESEALRACQFMECGLGSHLHHLVLEVGMPVVQNARKIAVAVEQFLKTNPRGMRLKSFSCSGLEYFQTPLYRIALHRVRMVRALCTFLRKQRWLEEVDLACSQMGRDDGCRVLKALTYSGRRSKNKKHKSWLTHIEMRDFFLEDVDAEKLHMQMGKFQSLVEIRLNFTYLHDAVLEQLVTTTSRLRFIAIAVDDTHLSHIVQRALRNSLPTTAGWQAAAERCRMVRVGVDMRGKFEMSDFHRVLVPGMPLAELSISTLVSSVFFWPESMLSHIASVMDFLGRHCAGYLKLVRLVQRCKALRCLWLTLRLPAETAVQIATVCKELDGDYLDLRVAGFEPEVNLPPNFAAAIVPLSVRPLHNRNFLLVQDQCH
nr:hypothetical protein BaRGS_034408 [Batillaria attramentaria]